MAIFDWKPEYSVGDAQLDREHRELFIRAGALHRAMTEGRGGEMVRELLKALADYTNTHFRGEEAWMARSSYPLAIQHCREHEEFRKTIREMSTRQSNTLTVELMQYLGSWLRRHIAENDQKISDFRKKQAAVREPVAAR